MSETRNAYRNRNKRPGEDVRAPVLTKRLFAGSAVVVIALLLAGTARAQQPGDKWLGDEERGRLERLRDGGNEALYNLDFAAAGRILRTRPTLPATSRRPATPGRRAAVRNALQLAPGPGLALRHEVILPEGRRAERP